MEYPAPLPSSEGTGHIQGLMEGPGEEEAFYYA